jgi:phage shock protein PspC (stress-responsive transcriptional regulator)
MARTLTRDPRHSVLGGVASGFGRYLDVDPVLVRIAFVILAFANGLGILLYLICWVIVPKETPAGAVPSGMESAFAGAQDAVRTMARADDGRAARLAIGYGLIGLGTVLLLHNLDWIHWPAWARFEVLWPLILVGMGAGLVLRAVHKEPVA